MPAISTAIICIVLLAVVGAGVDNYYSSSAEIAEFKTIQSTVDQQRADGISDLERATLTQTIIGANKWLAYRQYENSVWYGDTVPDEIDTLKPVK